MPNYDRYDKSYFEEGVARGISGYTNFAWQPEFTIPLAHRLIKLLGIEECMTVLDYGCAKGFLVKALRLLGVNALGCDVSGYALGMSPPEVRPFLRHSQDATIPFTEAFNWIIAKDVLEHLDETELATFLASAQEHAQDLFVIVPLGDGQKYNIPHYEDDITHVLRWSLPRWESVLKQNGWTCFRTTTDMRGIKDSWAHFPQGNAAFWCHNAGRRIV